jgi:hypothetical protein
MFTSSENNPLGSTGLCVFNDLLGSFVTISFVRHFSLLRVGAAHRASFLNFSLFPFRMDKSVVRPFGDHSAFLLVVSYDILFGRTTTSLVDTRQRSSQMAGDSSGVRLRVCRKQNDGFESNVSRGRNRREF